MKKQTHAYYCAQLSDVVKHIYSNLDQPPTVNELAEIACLSPYYFQRVFTQIAGENCVAMARRLRLERSAWQLQNTQASISEIAYQAGFNSLEAFSRAFRKLFGSTATDFREARWLSYSLLTANGTHFSPNTAPSFYPVATRREIPFTVEPIEPFQVSAKLHRGAPHLLGKTCLSFAAELRKMGIDLRQNPVVTYSPNLRDTPVGRIESYVAVCAELPASTGTRAATLGGGLHLVARHVGTGPQLGDFWIRLWKEAVPASGHAPADAPCYQTLQMGLYADEPATILTNLYIPLKPK